MDLSPYDDRTRAFADTKLKRQRKLQNYLQDKFKRHFKKLPQIQKPKHLDTVSPLATEQTMMALTGEDQQMSAQDELTERVLRRLQSLTASKIPPPQTTPRGSMEDFGREESTMSLMSTTSGTKLPPIGENKLHRTSSLLLLDPRRSMGFLEMPEDLQAIIAEHSSDAAVEISKLQMERSMSFLSDVDELDARSTSARKLSLDEMIARLPHGPHFKQHGVADMEEVDQSRLTDRESSGDMGSDNASRMRIPLERRILEFNDLAVEPDDVPNMQLKLAIIAHPLAAGAELTALLTTAVNSLADRCRSVGMSLVVFNSSWGYPNELVPEDQAYDHLESLEKFLTPDGSLIVIMMLLNDKFGQWLLPKRMSEATYTYLFNRASGAQERAMEQLAAINRAHKEVILRRTSSTSDAGLVEQGSRKVSSDEERNPPLTVSASVPVTTGNLSQIDQLAKEDPNLPAEETPIPGDKANVENAANKEEPNQANLKEQTAEQTENAGKAAVDLPRIESGETTTDEEAMTPPKSTKFRRAVKNLQNHSLILRSVLKDFDPYKNDPAMLSKWYVQNPYSTSTDYFLVDHRVRFANIKESGTASSDYLDERMRLTALLHKYGKSQPTFFQSAFSKEVTCALKSCPNAEVFVAVRRFVDFNASDKEAVPKFANYNRRKTGIIEYDPEAQTQLESLISFIKSKVPIERHITSAVRWSSQGLNPVTSYEHLAYVEKVVADAVSQVSDCITRFLSTNRWSSALSMAQPSTPSGSLQLSMQRPSEEILADISTHLDSLQKLNSRWKYDYDNQLEECFQAAIANQYTFICGESGSGKTILMAKLTTKLRSQLPTKRRNPVVVYRKIGLTGRSANVRLLICDLKYQIDGMFRFGTPTPTNKQPFDTTYLGIENEFEKTLALATKSRPIYIVLDGIYRLQDFYNAQNLKWLSQNRYDHVHMIMSLTSEDPTSIDSVKTAMSNKSIPINFFFMHPIPPTVVRQHMSDFLRRNEIAPEEIVDDFLEYFTNSSPEKSPQINSFLFLYLVCQKIIKGTYETAKLPTSLKAAVVALFSDAEAKLGELVVRRAVGFIANTRLGLSRLELCDLLTQDSAVSVALRSSLNLPIFLTPPSIVSYLIDNLLAPVLSERFCEGWRLSVISFNLAKQVALDRYVNNVASYGREITDYFLSNWSNHPRYVDSLRRYERVHVCSQPITIIPDPKWKLPGASERPNIRRIDELPFAELLAGQKAVSIDALKGDCFINYDFLLAACAARGLAYVLDIFQWVLDRRSGEPDDELPLIYECLKLSRSVLQRDITQLGSQLCGRLAGPVSKDIPLAPGDPPKLLNVRNLMRHISNHRRPSLVASGSALLAPGKSTFIELNGGHRLPITAIAVADDNSMLLTAAKDNKMILWDLRLGGRIIRLIHNIGADVKNMIMARNNELLLVVESSSLAVWRIATAECVKVLMNDFIDPLAITLLNNGNWAVGCLHNSSKISIWNLVEKDGNFGRVEKIVDLGDFLDPLLKSSTAQVLLPYNTSPDSLLLVACQRSNFAIAWNVEAGKLAQKLRIQHKFGSIQAVGRGAEVFAVAYMAYEENNRAVISVIDLFLTSEKYQLIHSIHGCRYDEIDKIYVNSGGSYAVATYKNYRTNASHFMIWNLDTEDHKHIGTHNGITDLVSASSLNCICTADRRNNRILVWNLAVEVTKRMPKYRPKYYVNEIQRMQDYSQYAITRSSNNGPITVWNVYLARCAGKSVRIEHGITGDQTDVLLLRNTRLLVLTEVKSIINSTSSGGDSHVRTQIFSAFRLYDVLRRVLIRRVADVIVPLGSSDDFVFYEHNRFLGLSESRTEFIVWEVDTGHQVMRIRPNVESMLDVLDPMVARIRGRRQSAQRLTTAHRRFLGHLQSEFRNSIYEFVVSDDMTTIVTSHYSHYLCVIESSNNWFRHIQTMTEADSLMLLTVSALSPDGRYLITYSYDERDKNTYVTAWNAKEGKRVRRMAGQRGVGALAVSRDMNLVLIGKESGEMRIWEPRKHGSERIIPGYPGASFQPGKSRIWLSDDSTIAFCLANEISAWDIKREMVLAIFTPDVSIQCMNVALGGKMAVFGTSESMTLITLKISTLDYTDLALHSQDAANVFGELRDPVEEMDDADEELK